MLRHFCLLCFASVMQAASPLDGAKQALLVTSPDWNSNAATLVRYERSGAKGSWRQVGQPTPVVLGKNGMAWGVGLHPQPSLDGPRKQEGDGRSPAGVFRITELFGSSQQRIGSHTKYHPLAPDTECVDDTSSREYNKIVERRTFPSPDWNSSEKMLEVGEAYRWGAVVAHNAAPPRPGAGSCIFLHISTNTTGTAGCTAMKEDSLVEILKWLRDEKKPVLVQLPKTAYKSLRTDWKLP